MLHPCTLKGTSWTTSNNGPCIRKRGEHEGTWYWSRSLSASRPSRCLSVSNWPGETSDDECRCRTEDGAPPNHGLDDDAARTSSTSTCGGICRPETSSMAGTTTTPKLRVAIPPDEAITGEDHQGSGSGAGPGGGGYGGRQVGDSMC